MEEAPAALLEWSKGVEHEAGVGGALQFLMNFIATEMELASRLASNSAGVGLFVYLLMDVDLPYGGESEFDLAAAKKRTQALCRRVFIEHKKLWPVNQRLSEP